MNDHAVPFSLRNSLSQQISFPSDKPSVICFVKEDCPTCNEVMPILQDLFDAHADALDIHIIGQTQDGNNKLIANHNLTAPILDDSELRSSCRLARPVVMACWPFPNQLRIRTHGVQAKYGGDPISVKFS